jgi:hypothetical protein
MSEYKTALTPKERIKCAYLHIIRGVPVQDLAIAYEVNTGRISEAISAIEKAIENPKAFLSNDDDEALRVVR